tara:strand:+ start:556 stop:2262 length:1707 start_codon:yes stop_codon:yes gene_type:complete
MPELRSHQFSGGKNATAMILAAGITGPEQLTRNYPCRYGYYGDLESFRSGGYKPRGCITATDAAFRWLCETFLIGGAAASDWVAPHPDKRKSATRYMHTICPQLGLLDEGAAIARLKGYREWRPQFTEYAADPDDVKWREIRAYLQGLDDFSHLWALFYAPRPLFWIGLRSNFPISPGSKKLFMDGFKLDRIMNNKFLRVIDEIDDLTYDGTSTIADTKKVKNAWLMALSRRNGMSVRDVAFTKQLQRATADPAQPPDMQEIALMSAISGNGIPPELIAILVAHSIKTGGGGAPAPAAAAAAAPADAANKERAGLLIIQSMMSNDRELNAKLVAIAMKFKFFEHLEAANIQQFFHPIITAYAVGKADSRDPALAYALLAMSVARGANTQILLPQIISAVLSPTPATKAKVDRLSLELMVAYNNGFTEIFKMVNTLGDRVTPDSREKEKKWFKRLIAPDSDPSKTWLQGVIDDAVDAVEDPVKIARIQLDRNKELVETVQSNASIWDEFKAIDNAINNPQSGPKSDTKSTEHISWEALQSLKLGAGTAASVAAQLPLAYATRGGSNFVL